MRQPIPFGKYLLLERISVGGMAEVFKAKAFGVEGFEKIIAIKRILPTMVEDADFIQMFIDEAKIAGQLSHANICQIFELGKIAESHFIAMEYVWGKDLLQIQNRFRKLRLHMPVTMAAFVAAKMCEGLDYAHKKKDSRGQPLLVVHRDVSPQNILVSYEGEIKLIDFGIAKAATRSSKTQAGVLKGKFGYMSPEQVRGLPLDRRSDLFALGTILYELLTGERLFLGESDFSTLERVRNVDIQPPSKHNKHIPPALEKIVMKALAKEPEDRYQWANELQEELLSFVMAVQPVFTLKQLAAWMKEAFSAELARERQLLEQYKKLGRDGIIAGKPVAESMLSVEQGLGKPAPPEEGSERTDLGPPSFDDALAESLAGAPEVLTGATLAAVKAVPAGTPPAGRQALPGGAALRPGSSGAAAAVAPVQAAPGRSSRGGVQGFGDEGPTELFGEVESRPMAAVKVAAESTVILPGGSSAASTEPSAAAAPAEPPAPSATFATAAPSATSAPSAPSVSLVPPPQPSLPPAASLISLPGATNGPLVPLAVALGSLPPVPGAPAGVPYGFAPGGTSAVDLPAARPPTRRSSRFALALPWLTRALLRDLGIGAGVAVLVLGLVVGGRFVLGASPRLPVATSGPTTGTIVIAADDHGAGEVFVNGARKGALVAGAEPVSVEGLGDGEYLVEIQRPGVPSYSQVVRLNAHHPEVVIAHFEPVRIAHGKLTLRLLTEGATVLVDNQEISAEAVKEPLELAPRVEHTITIERDGYVSQQVPVVLGEGEAQEREIALVPVEAPRRPLPRPQVAPRPRPAVPDAAPDTFESDGARGRTGSSDEHRTTPTPPPPPTAPTTVAGVGDVGYLIANTTPYAKVLIDGKDTGKMTPIAPRAKIPLKPGKHTVTFVSGADSFNYPIVIEAGRDHHLIKTLPVE